MRFVKADRVSQLRKPGRAAECRAAGHARSVIVKSARVLAAFVVLAAAVAAQTGGYRKPPQAVLDVLNAPLPPVALVSPARDRVVLATSTRYPPISDLAQPMLRLAGLRINPNTSAPHQLGYYVKLSLKNIETGTETTIALPAGAQAAYLTWSGDGRRFAFANRTPTGLELWVGDAATGKVSKLRGITVSAVYGEPFQWMPDNRTLLVQLVPAGRGQLRPSPTVPREPNIQESSGRAGPVRTYQDLLRNPYDEEQFEYYATAQLAAVDAASGKATPIGRPAIFETVRPSPDGRYILVSRIQRPFSYLYPVNDFPKEVEVWDATGKLAHKIASLPLQDQVPIDGVQTGPRRYAWRPTEPATLVWAEALDEGDPKKKVEHRDRVLMLKAPFAGTPAEIFRTPHRLQALSWFETGGTLLVSDYERDTRKATTWIVSADRPNESRQVWSRNVQDRYNDPGQPVTRLLPSNHRAILVHNNHIYLAGAGASKEGDRPFLDRFDLQALKAERLFHSDARSYETFTALLKDDASQFITRRESPNDPPNYFVHAIPAGAGGSVPSTATRALTDYADPTPQLRGIRKQLVTYKRKDGVPLSFTLYLPPGHKEGTRLPTVVWAYPLEFNDADTAGQVTGSAQRYTTIGGTSHLFFLLNGYAVLDNATMPVVGTPEKVNDTYVEQITQSAEAAIDKAVEMGVADRERVGVGGHSYGAFMTANLLAHTDVFRAGIARSGAYNRTLTPFGFQSERRILWEAPETYIKVSPFMQAHRINEPILLIHGEADNNTGTFPMQSERMYQAIRGTGGTVRLVMLPLESHGYSARESTEHVLAEMLDWFDRHVKNAPPRSRSREAASKEEGK
ncbi:MAG TPA: prolyl oligopeptidase family serine peptidase [Pyrinomonadaceae bacterium]|nr:prolyl oligopeptidase family serine peptidase [Pyrinomonadaceae bacterium]